MTRRVDLRRALAAILALAAHGSCASSRENRTPEAISGCYEMKVSDWQPRLPLEGDAEFITPPDRIHLELEKPERGWRKGSYLVRPLPGSRSSIFRSGEWVFSDDEVRILWTTGFSGLTMDLSITRHGLRGLAHTFWDFPRPTQTAAVEAKRVSCTD
jgi:hypothetical protein